MQQQAWLRLAGGAFLCYLGARTLLSRPAERPAGSQGQGVLGAYLSTFLLTLINPLTILSFAVAFAGLGLAQTGGDFTAAAATVAGVFAGSAAWWFLLSGGVSLLAGRFDCCGSTGFRAGHHRVRGRGVGRAGPIGGAGVGAGKRLTAAES